MAYGTAPRKVNGVWQTRSGRKLTPAGQRYWDRQVTLGRFDESGHRKRIAEATTSKGTLRKPGFSTFLKASHGDKQAQQEVNSYIAKHEARQKTKAEDEARLNQRALGPALPAALKAHKVVNPVAGEVIKSLSPTTSLKDLAHAAREGNVPAAGVAAAGLLPLPFGKGAKAVKAAKDALKAERAANEVGPIVRLANTRPGGEAYIKKPAVYLRFGDLPKGGAPSINHLTGEPEAGVSVYYAWYDPKTKKYVLPSGSEQYINTQQALAGTRHASIRLVRGKEIVDVGGDGEPLLHAGSVKPEKIIHPDDIVFEQDPYMTLTGKELPPDQWPDWHPRGQNLGGTDPYSAVGNADWDARRVVGPPEVQAAGERLATPAERAAALTGQVAEAASKSKPQRELRKGLISEERARRAKAGGQAQEIAGGGTAGHIASKKELAGEMTSAHVRFDALSHLDDNQWEQLVREAQTHPDLQFYDQLNLVDTLAKMRAGHPPTDAEVKLIERAFGEKAAAEATKLSLAQKAGRTALDVANIPRAIMSSADVSAVLRQSLVATLHRPGVAARNIGPMFKMAFSEKFYDDAMVAIQKDPRFRRAVEQDGLKMTDLAGTVGTREEAYPTQLAERIPVAGHVVRGSGRAYTGFINVMRWHVYTELLELAESSGQLTPKLRKDAARVANWATGRGELPGKTLESAAPLLNTVFFSPRLMASRFQTFNPFFYGKLDPVARKYAMKAGVKTFLTGMSVLGAAAAAGARVGMDPTSADFGKIRVGDTRVDVWGGHQQWARLMGQLAEGKITSSTTGEVEKLSGGFAGSSRWDVASKFLQGKFSPPASLIRDWAKKEDFAHKPFSWKTAVVSRIYPLMVQDMLDTYKEYGLGAAVATYGVGGFGVGIQTYKTKPKKKSTRSARKGYTPSWERKSDSSYVPSWER